MNTLTIRPQNQSNTTTIENHFIDVFMPKANGEFVKIYLYLIRIMNDPTCASTLSTIADVMEHTEKDLLRGLSYWEKEGLLNISRDPSGHISAIDIVPASTLSNRTEIAPTPVTSVVASLPQEPDMATTAVLPTLDNFSATCISTVTSALSPSAPVVATSTEDTTIEKVTETPKSNEDFKQLLYIAQCYLEKPLSKSEVEKFQFFYDDLGFSGELIDYLIEYCVEHGHKSIHYINAVALAWSNDGISTVEEAKNQVSRHNKCYRIILRSFGISGRDPVANEIKLMDKWMNEFHFTLEMIHAACEKTLANTHNPSFNYADAIITSWYKQNARSLSDIDRLDAEYSKSKSTQSPKHLQAAPAKVRPASFKQQDYDFDAINKQLFKVQ